MSKKFSHIGQAFSQLGQAFMLPIAILPVADLLLGLGGALTNKVAVTSYPFAKPTAKPIEKIRAKLLKTALPAKFIIFRIV